MWCTGFSLLWLSCCRARARGCKGFSSCVTWALGHRLNNYGTGSIIMAQGLNCSSACGIFWKHASNPRLLHWKADSLPLSHHVSHWSSFFLIVVLDLGLYSLTQPEIEGLTAASRGRCSQRRPAAGDGRKASPGCVTDNRWLCCKALVAKRNRRKHQGIKNGREHSCGHPRSKL